MPDLLLELFSEEIPARMQARAADDLRSRVTDALVAAGYVYEGAKAYATPRRLTLNVVGLPKKGRDVREERRGPRVGAPEAALKGFLKSAGIVSTDQVKTLVDPKKGEFYVAVIERPGRPTAEFLAEILPGLLRDFPWPKSMRWGAASAEPGSLRWVRPLHSILCTFGDEAEAPEIVDFALDEIAAGDTTHGHRFMAPGRIRARRFDDYLAALAAAKVVLDPERRRDMIRHDARDLAFAAGLEVVEDEALLVEVAGLVEWPVPLIGGFDESFLKIPPEVIRATIRANQKCFVLKGADGALANRFVLVANIEASDGGARIVAGNERVVRARLSDAKFFWESDLRSHPDFIESGLKPLDQRLARLRALDIVFHEKLGTQAERVDRIAALARELAPIVGADPDLAERAAHLSKADLVTEMVGEFPELQGLMGRYYAAAQGEDPAVAAAIEDHYRPLGPTDRVPTDPVSVAVALADKLDTLVGFWAIDEKPTGSKDPFALRRAALGVIRLVLENGVRLDLASAYRKAGRLIARELGAQTAEKMHAAAHGFSDVPLPLSISVQDGALDQAASSVAQTLDRAETDLLLFFHDRLKIYLRDKGARHDLIDAVLSANAVPASPPVGSMAAQRPEGGQAGGIWPAGDAGGTTPAPDPSPQGGGDSVGAPANGDLLAVVRRVEALGRFLETEDGRNLLAGYKRAANILRIEEKKDGRAFDGMPDVAALEQDEERALALALARASGAASQAVAAEDFEGGMRALAELRPVVDAFFERVTVNADVPALRENRLRLLNMFRRATREVADFARIEG